MAAANNPTVVDSLLHQLMVERDSLRNQNVELFKLIAATKNASHSAVDRAIQTDAARMMHAESMTDTTGVSEAHRSPAMPMVESKRLAAREAPVTEIMPAVMANKARPLSINASLDALSGVPLPPRSLVSSPQDDQPWNPFVESQPAMQKMPEMAQLVVPSRDDNVQRRTSEPLLSQSVQSTPKSVIINQAAPQSATPLLGGNLATDVVKESSAQAASTPAEAKRNVPGTAETRIDLLANAQDLSVAVLFSSTHLDEKRQEYTMYAIAVKDASGERWRVQKRYSDFLQLHDHIKHRQPRSVVNKVGKRPDKTAFTSGKSAPAPSKMDEQRQLLQDYLTTVLAESINDRYDILAFLSTDLIAESHRQSFVFSDAVMEGYLVKKQKHLNGWIRRFFVLRHERLDYFDSKESAYQAARQLQSGDAKPVTPLGTIRMRNARIAKQRSTPSSEKMADYRHALMISETSAEKEKAAAKRIVLCAESDAQRDDWSFFLVRQVELIRQEAEQDMRKKYAEAMSSPFQDNMGFSPQQQVVLDPPPRESPPRPPANGSSMVKLMPNAAPVAAGQSNVFGVTLDQAVAYCRVTPECALPAVVTRCIEYLEFKQAFMEEGLYRLSGDHSSIKMLRQRFEQGDVNLVTEEHDVHAIAGLLKLYLRELPHSIVTNELHRQFVHAIDYADREARISQLQVLVGQLPLANYSLLRALVAHLITVVAQSNVNKMTALNVGIVFSPTLGLPAGIFTLMMAEFDVIFGVNNKKLPNVAEQDNNSKFDAMAPRSLKRAESTMRRVSQNFDEKITAFEDASTEIDLLSSGVAGLTEAELVIEAPPVPPVRRNRSTIIAAESPKQESAGRRREVQMVVPDHQDEKQSQWISPDKLQLNLPSSENTEKAKKRQSKWGDAKRVVTFDEKVHTAPEPREAEEDFSESVVVFEEEGDDDSDTATEVATMPSFKRASANPFGF